MKRGPCLPGDRPAKKPRTSDPPPPWPGHDSIALNETTETLQDSFNSADWEVVDIYRDQYGNTWEMWRHRRDNWEWWWDGQQWWDGQ